MTGYLPHYKWFGSYIVPEDRRPVRPDVHEQTGPAGQLRRHAERQRRHLSRRTTACPTPSSHQSLGRPLAGNAANVTVNLIEPGRRYGDRINELDLRVAKILRFGRMRATLSADVYNLINAAPILSYNEAFIPGGAWLLPTSVMTARFARLNVQLDF